MSYDLTVTIPEYEIELERKSAPENVAKLIEMAIDEIAMQWMQRNPGHTFSEAKEKCNVRFSIRIKPVLQQL